MQYHKPNLKNFSSEKKEEGEEAEFSEQKNYSLDSDEEDNVRSKKLEVDDIDGQEATTMVDTWWHCSASSIFFTLQSLAKCFENSRRSSCISKVYNVLMCIDSKCAFFLKHALTINFAC